MAYDEKQAERIRDALRRRDDVIDVVEKKMFGGLCFMVDGAMCVGLTSTDLMVRVGAPNYAAALDQPHARPMTFTGRPLSGFIYVGRDGIRTAPALAKWINRALTFIRSPEFAAAQKKTKRKAANATPRKSAKLRVARAKRT
jgi:TfoX/Sxy family transcriptional regulator of competence genes